MRDHTMAHSDAERPIDPVTDPVTEPIASAGIRPPDPAGPAGTRPAEPGGGPGTRPADAGVRPSESSESRSPLSAELSDPAVARSAESPPEAALVPDPGGWLSAVRTHLAFAVVLLVAAVGIVRIVEYHWRQGAALIGGTLVLAALFRALLPPRRAGLLAVRGRPVDVLCYVGLGALVLFVALTIQGGPFG